jgi:two-component system, LuxR family, response regulator FixJ
MTDLRLIHLVDDDEAIRHSASFMLRHAGFRVKTYTDGVAFLDQVADAERGCILLDVQMPGMDGLEVQEALNARGVAMPVIVLTGHGDVAVAVRAMKAGAVDFVEKPYAKQTLVDALTRAFERLEMRRKEDVLAEEARGLIERLTARERDVLTGLVDGQTNKVIAETLDISPRTVEIHRANLMEKMDAPSLSTVLRIAFAAGFGRSAAS